MHGKGEFAGVALDCLLDKIFFLPGLACVLLATRADTFAPLR